MKKIPLTKNQIAIVDDEDYEYLMQWKWHAKYNEYTKTYYAARRGRQDEGLMWKKYIYMHRVLSSCPSDMFVDHINHATSDNQKFNLRNVTKSQNGMNRGIQSNNTFGIKGVWQRTENNTWRASIAINGKKINLGKFQTKEEAIEARQEAEERYFGEYRFKSQ